MPKKTKRDQKKKKIDLQMDDHERIEEKTPEKEKDESKKASRPKERKQDRYREDATKAFAKVTSNLREDMLADIRQELVSDELKTEDKRGLFKRIKDTFINKPTISDHENKEKNVEIEEKLPSLRLDTKPNAKDQVRSKQDEKAIQEFFEDLDVISSVLVDKEKPKKKKIPRFPVRSDDEVEIDDQEIRKVALEDYDETHIEVETGKETSIREILQNTIKDLSLIEKRILIALLAITVGALLISGIFLIASSFMSSMATPTPEFNLSEMIYPSRIILPGGWGFDLGQGQVVDGLWEPKGPEWLISTEISRWVALPWNIQLEAVLRTLKPDDQIELQMSNFDLMQFNVYSIKEMSMDEILSIDPKTPSLIIVLYDDEVEDGLYWVVAALP